MISTVTYSDDKMDELMKEELLELQPKSGYILFNCIIEIYMYGMYT